MSDGLMIITIFSSIILVPILIVFMIYKINKFIRGKKNKNYQGKTIGKVIFLKSKGLNSPIIITVEYLVNCISYSIKKTMKLKSEPIKLGAIPIGQRKVPIIGKVRIGSSVYVKYDLNNPTKALIEGNDGFINC